MINTFIFSSSRRSVPRRPATLLSSHCNPIRTFSVLTRLADSPEKLQLIEQLHSNANLFGGAISTELMTYEPYLPVSALQSVMSSAVEIGLPWWMSIACITMSYRVASWKIQVDAMRVMRTRRTSLTDYEPARIAIAESVARKDYALAKQQMLELNQEMQKNRLIGFSKESVRLLVSNACWFMTLFAAVRGMVAHPEVFPGFALNSGFACIPSLAVADPFGVLPVLSSMAFLGSLEMREEFKDHPQHQKMKLAIRGITFAMLPVTSSLPAAFYVYMATNAAFNAGFALWVRKYLKR